MGTPISADHLERAAALLEAHPDFRVIRTLPSPDRIVLPMPEGKVRRAVVIDTETTSLDHRTGKIIQIAICPVDFDAKARIVRIGRELGVSDRGLVVALAAAMQESSLRNIASGHLDSVGLFQQRPSTGWGETEQILDADYAIRAFFTGVHTEEITVRGLLDLPDWESMSIGDAAQAVQISAHPDAYGKWETDAWSWLAVIA